MRRAPRRPSPHRKRTPRYRVLSTDIAIWIPAEEADDYARTGWTIKDAGPGQHHDASYGMVLAVRTMPHPTKRWI